MLETAQSGHPMMPIGEFAKLKENTGGLQSRKLTFLAADDEAPPPLPMSVENKGSSNISPVEGRGQKVPAEHHSSEEVILPSASLTTTTSTTSAAPQSEAKTNSEELAEIMANDAGVSMAASSSGRQSYHQ